MHRPTTFRTFRFRSSLCVGLCASIAACAPERNQQADPAVAAQNDAALPAAPALPEPAILDRETLLLATAQAASAAASGREDGQVQEQLDGARFTFAIRFGCGAQEEQPAPAAPTAPKPKAAAKADTGPTGAQPVSPVQARPAMSWHYDPERKRLQVVATPDLDLADPVIAAIARGGGYEAVDGFWVRRPWLLQPSCPAATPAAVPGLPSSPTIAIAQFHGAEDSRVQRRDHRGYESVATLPPEDARGLVQGFDLILSGRLRRLADKRVIACIPNGADAPPACVISVEIQGVALRRADTGAIQADWSPG